MTEEESFKLQNILREEAKKGNLMLEIHTLNSILIEKMAFENAIAS